jgi:hypothetical protein
LMIWRRGWLWGFCLWCAFSEKGDSY